MKNIYFLGIGGIGMSALAKFFHLQGKQVSGYDRNESVVTRSLEDAGISVFYQPDPSHLNEQDIVIYTPAIPQSHPEFQEAIQREIPMLKRAQVLGKISETHQTIAIAGTHGKTTTSSMTAHFLRACGLDCTAFLGGLANNFQSNFVFGQSEWMVVEADEYDRSFMTLHPQVTVILSVDADHLDIYGSEEEVRKSYQQFAGQLADDGLLLVSDEIPAADWGREVTTFGIESGMYKAENLRFGKLETVFDFIGPNIRIPYVRLPMPGIHNVLNATAAMCIALKLGAEKSELVEAVKSFQGIYRRFEVHHHSEELTYIDDYAHHPTELTASISSARSMFPYRQLVVLFQPHLYSRTRDFHEGFAKALSEADVVLLMDIYPAREEPIEGVSVELIRKQIEFAHSKHIEREHLLTDLSKVIEFPSVLLSLGAGDIDQETHRIKDWIHSLTHIDQE